MPRLGPAVLLLALAAPAAAEEGAPTYYIGVGAGGRLNFGDLGERYGYGILFPVEVEAGFQPTVVGVSWTFRYWRNYSTSVENLSAYLVKVDLGLHLKVRQRLSDRVPVFAWGRAGVELVRWDNPVPPDESQMHVGPAVSAGLAVAVSDGTLISMGVGYDLVLGGPGGAEIVIGVQLGD